MTNKKKKHKASTLAALLEEKPRRGRPRHAVSRQNVYVALSPAQKTQMDQLADRLPPSLSRADLADLAVTTLTVRLEALRRAVADRNREIPEGVTDFESLYLLWDLPLPEEEKSKWTSIRVSPQQAIELGRVHGTLHAIFGANRSQTFSLALALLSQFLHTKSLPKQVTLDQARQKISQVYL
ncbi:MAG: hypothetical protein R6X32_03255 [Chloroflexota bacterium]|jgi:hypothetical protein